MTGFCYLTDFQIQKEIIEHVDPRVLLSYSLPLGSNSVKLQTKI